MPIQNQPAQALAVSVIIPAFNAASYVGAALQSVFAQTFAGYEVILINDGSSDTEQLERVIQPLLSRITYLTQENRGPSGARNLGIRHARGEWLAFLDSDDVWMPNYLAEQLRFLAADRAMDMVYCDATLEGEIGTVGKTFMQLCPSNGPVTFESLLEEQTQVLTSGTVVRRESVMRAKITISGCGSRSREARFRIGESRCCAAMCGRAVRDRLRRVCSPAKFKRSRNWIVILI